MKFLPRSVTVAAIATTLAATVIGCAKPVAQPEYYGTLAPFASEAVYFVVTDRFVDGDRSNNHEFQGPKPYGSFDRPIQDLDGRPANIGYLGGDFRGILDNADYINSMGFTSVWITPIVDNPDEAFSGGTKLGEAFFADHGKTGYHGYWGVNFFVEDEHLVSPGLAFADFTRQMQSEHEMKVVLDIVCNHGSPSWSMPQEQAKFGEIRGLDGSLVADHQNLPPAELDPQNPLHRFFHGEPDLAELSNIDETNPEVLEYFVQAYLQWIDQGAAAFRIDTIKHMPHSYWKAFSDRIRAVHPDFFMFGESFDYDAAKIATHTYPENGAISVLDFPGRQRINEVFSTTQSSFAELADYLHLDDGIYQNPYELMSFYDNHDMPRMAATDEGFIDANNWVFTARGIPVIYYGSEIGFMAGAPEHGGNRDYFGKENIELAQGHPIKTALSKIANIRRESPALQKGLQANIALQGDTAAFLRVYQFEDTAQTALVLLNKGSEESMVTADKWLSTGQWTDAASGEHLQLDEGDTRIEVSVPGHGVRVLLFNGASNNPDLALELQRLHSAARRPN